MKRLLFLLRSAAATGVCLLVFGCGDEDPPKPGGPGLRADTPAPEFHLTDVNPNSATHGQSVSPRDYLGRVSAWYFGYASPG